jgi:hypothetical protein
MLTHILKRGVAHLQTASPSSDYIVQLRADAELYNNAGPEIKPLEAVPVLVTGVVLFVILGLVSLPLPDNGDEFYY